MGLSGDSNNVQALNSTFSSPPEVQCVQERLEQIFVLFADAEGISQKFKSRNDSTCTESQ